MFKGIDRTIGSRTLEWISQNHYDGLDKLGRFQQFEIVELFKSRMNIDWILNLLCQYHQRGYVLGDMLWYKKIIQMIDYGSLYVCLKPVEDWAFKDIEITSNVSNLKSIGVSVDLSNKRNSDGLFRSSDPIEFCKVYQNESDIPSEIETITIENAFGVVEFGTQKLCKSAYSLSINDILLRVPYQSHIKYPSPVAAFFINTHNFTS